MKTGYKPNLEIKRKIAKLVESGFSFPEIARILGFNSRQAVRYHYEYLKKFSTGEGLDKPFGYDTMEQRSRKKIT